MELTVQVGTWSSCFRRKVGAVIVRDKRVMTTGYNGAPAGIASCIERGECLREKLNIPSGTRAELCYGVHAEQNAIISAPRDKMIGATMYLCGREVDTGEYVKNSCCCSLCKRFVINAGIKRVVIRDDKDNYRVIEVLDWIMNDESLEGTLGY